MAPGAPRPARSAALATVAALGVLGAALLAAEGHMGVGHTVVLLGWALGAAGVAALAAAFLMRRCRHSRLAVQASIAALAPVLAVTVALVGTATTMFLSPHDLRALLVVLVAAGTVGLVTALALGERVHAASLTLGDLAQRIGDGKEAVTGGDRPPRNGPSELVRLAAELEAAQARLADSRAQAAAAEDSRGQLVAWVSHDLRTPLAGIRAMAEALEDGVVDDRETVARYYRTIGQETDRLAGLVDDLLELSRIQAGTLDLDLREIPLDQLLSDAVAGVSVAAAAKGVLLRGEVVTPPPVVELSVPEMGRVVHNLLDNAIRHTPRGGTVWVDARFDEDRRAAVVSVRDGCGGVAIPELPRGFELAYGGQSVGTAGGGDGLGLAVARGLVEAQHGEISVHSEGEGCRFTIRLPLGRPPVDVSAVRVPSGR